MFKLTQAIQELGAAFSAPLDPAPATINAERPPAETFLLRYVTSKFQTSRASPFSSFTLSYPFIPNTAPNGILALHILCEFGYH